MGMSIVTFSGTHPFRPGCLSSAYKEYLALEGFDPDDARDEAIEFVAGRLALIDNGKCPRCERPLDVNPSGSRQTDCRCIPICSECSEAEALAPLALSQIAGAEDAVLLPLLDAVTEWPINSSAQGRALAEYKRRLEPAFVFFDLEGDPAMIHSGGAARLVIEPSSGWLKFGFDDSEDTREREQ
jgi:hypothetical protein